CRDQGSTDRKRAEYAARQVTKARKAVEKDEDKRPPPLLATVKMLREHNDWNGIFAWNDFAKRITVQSQIPGAPYRGHPVPRDLGEVDASDTTLWMQQHGIKIASNTVREAIRVAAEDHPFHPIRDYLRSLRWDGVE